MKKQKTAFYSRPSFFIRIPLTLLLTWAVGRETGIWTAFSIFLIFVSLEFIGMMLSDIYDKLKNV